MGQYLTPEWDQAHAVRTRHWRQMYPKADTPIGTAKVALKLPAMTYMLQQNQNGSVLLFLDEMGAFKGSTHDGRNHGIFGKCVVKDRNGLKARRAFPIPSGMRIMTREFKPGELSEDAVVKAFGEHGENKMLEANRDDPNCHSAIHWLLELCKEGGSIVAEIR